MRILLVHNYYGSSAPSGENVVFEDELAMLSRQGHEVLPFIRSSDKIRGAGTWGVLKGAASAIWNPFTAKEISEVSDHFQPDIVHVHNTFPLISASIFRALRRPVAKVLTLHNYRLFCPAGTPVRNGSVCTECLDRKSTAPGILHGCYRGSSLATLPVALSIELNRALGTWEHHVDAFIALSQFQKEQLSSAGLDREKIYTKGNFYPGKPSVIPFRARTSAVVFVGRLAQEKGVQDLISAWQAWGPSAPLLRIIGDGPLRSDLEQQALGLPIEFMGQLDKKEAEQEIARAKLLVIPSRWFEGFPMVIREAFAFGTPVAASRIGPLPSIVKDGTSGVLFTPGEPQSIFHTLNMTLQDNDLLVHLSRGARETFENQLTEEKNHENLMQIYRKAKSNAMSRP